MAQSVQRLATGWTVRGSSPGRGEVFRTRQDRPWVPPIQWVLGLFRKGGGVKRPERGAYHPPHLAPRLKKELSYNPTPPLDLRGLL